MGSVIRCVFAVLLIIFSAACDGGDGTAPMPLTVTITQSPTGPQEEGTTVVFNVTVTGGTGPYTTTNWSFPSGSTTSVTAGVLSATVVLGDPGTYSASVDVLDAGVPAGTYPFAFQVIPAIPVVTAVTPDEGLPLQQVTFFYQAEGVVTAQEWGFGEGATPQTSSDASPVVTFSEPGLYTGTLRVENANGAGDPFEFSYLVNIPEPPTWQVTEFREVRRSYLLDGLFSMTLAGGRPAIAYNSPEGIRLLRATVEVPEGPQHWTDTL
ncbi:MAG TPA: PKD domain-containing protein, partial [bacterium]|nr:PKD domain-containing protein [bacterium]